MSVAQGKSTEKRISDCRNLREVAARLGVPYSTAQHWRKQGLPRRDDGGWDLVAIAFWVADMRHNQGKVADGTASLEPQEPTEEGEGGKAFWDAEDKKWAALGKKFRLEQDKGLWLGKGEVEEHLAARSLELRNTFLSLARKWISQIQGLDMPEQLRIVEDEIRMVLAMFAREPTVGFDAAACERLVSFIRGEIDLGIE